MIKEKAVMLLKNHISVDLIELSRFSTSASLLFQSVVNLPSVKCLSTTNKVGFVCMIFFFSFFNVMNSDLLA